MGKLYFNKKKLSNIGQKESDGGKRFKELDVHIMNIQVWIRGIHHHCSKEYLQGYLDEHNFKSTEEMLWNDF
jgi:hypothetical protein